MIVLENLHLAFGRQTIFDDISANINKDNRIGLVGKNGSGKSTLLKVIAGKQNIDGGKVTIERGTKIGYMPQHVVMQSDKTIYEEALSAFEDLYTLKKEAALLERKLEYNDPNTYEYERILERYSHIHEELLHTDAAQAETETKKILTGLGLGPDKFQNKVSSLSLGWRMRLVLAKLLLQKAHFYLFDEPTNHLDITTKDWFLDFLQSSPFGFILVCHDRYFLDHLCKKTLELEHGNGTIYHGNYTYYAEQKEQRSAIQEQAALRQEKELAKKMKTVERFRASASKAKMAQSMLKKIEKTERIAIARKTKSIHFSFPSIARSGKSVLKVEDVAHAFGNKRVFQDVSFEVERGEKVAIVAANGVGKTTLFNVITGRLPLQSGSISLGHNVTSALFEQDQDKVLHPKHEILQEAEEACTSNETRALVRKFLGTFLFSGDDVYKKIEVLSGGEKNRVAMVKVMLQQANLLLLDEPTNHLDLESKEVLLSALRQFKGTILFVSHDRDFLDQLATRILELSSEGVISYSGNYESYIHQKRELNF